MFCGVKFDCGWWCDSLVHKISGKTMWDSVTKFNRCCIVWNHVLFTHFSSEENSHWTNFYRSCTSVCMKKNLTCKTIWLRNRIWANTGIQWAYRPSINERYCDIDIRPLAEPRSRVIVCNAAGAVVMKWAVPGAPRLLWIGFILLNYLPPICIQGLLCNSAEISNRNLQTL